MSRPTNYYSNLGIHYTSQPPPSHRPSSPRYRSSRHWRPGNQSEITFWSGESVSNNIENLTAKLVIKFEWDNVRSIHGVTDLAVADLCHVDAEVVPAAHPLHVLVALQTLPAVEELHAAVTAAVASVELTEIVVSDAVVPTDRVVLQTVTLLSAVVVLDFPVEAVAPPGALIPPGRLGRIELQVQWTVSDMINLYRGPQLSPCGETLPGC